jgi:threonine dehydratase
MIPFSSIEQAAERIRPYIQKTGLTYDDHHDLYLKWENHQVTGSFKIRGALNKILAEVPASGETARLQTSERPRVIVTASAGNHGQGVALAGKLVGATVIVFASDHAVEAKVAAMRDLGAEVRLVPGGYAEAEEAGLQFAASSGAAWVSPYNDLHVIAGQGTLVEEILQEKPELLNATWVVPGGGGGLISGVGAALKFRPDPPGPPSLIGTGGAGPTLIGVQSEASPFLYRLFHTGSQAGSVELPSLADGLSGPVEENSVTIPLSRSTVDDFVLVSEGEIAQAIAFAWRQYGERIEGSAAAALAAVLAKKVPSRPAVVVISGGNIQEEVHARIVRDK